MKRKTAGFAACAAIVAMALCAAFARPAGAADGTWYEGQLDIRQPPGTFGAVARLGQSGAILTGSISISGPDEALAGTYEVSGRVTRGRFRLHGRNATRGSFLWSGVIGPDGPQGNARVWTRGSRHKGSLGLAVAPPPDPASPIAGLRLFFDDFSYPEGAVIDHEERGAWRGRYPAPDPSAVVRDGRASLFGWRTLTTAVSFVNKRDTWTVVTATVEGAGGVAHLLVPNPAIGVSVGFDGTGLVTVRSNNLAAAGHRLSRVLRVQPDGGRIRVEIWMKDDLTEVFVEDAAGLQSTGRWHNQDVTGNIAYRVNLGYGGTYDDVGVYYSSADPPPSPEPRGPMLVTGALREGVIGADYHLPQAPWMVTQGVILPQQIRADAGTAPLVYEIVSGALPPGLAMSTAFADPTDDGSPDQWVAVLSGVPTETGTFPFRVRVADADGRTDERDYAITVTSVQPPSYDFVETFTGAQGQPVHDFPGSSWTGRYGAASVSAVFDANRAKVGTWGTITVVQGFRNSPLRPLGFGVRQFAGTAGGFQVLCASNPGFGVSVSYDGTSTVTVRSNNLGYAPQTISDTFTASARDDGTIALEIWLQGTASRTYVTGAQGLQATDLHANGRFAGDCENGDWLVRLGYSGLFDDVWVRDAAEMPEKINPVRVDTERVREAFEGVDYRDTLAAGAGKPPFQWSATGLPPGLAISADGVISGRSVAPGSYGPVVTVRDAAGQTASRTFALPVIPDPEGSLLYADRFELPDGLLAVYRDPENYGSLTHTDYALTYVGGQLEISAHEQGWLKQTFANDGVTPVSFSLEMTKGRMAVFQAGTCFGMEMEYDSIQHVSVRWNNLCYGPQSERQDLLLETVDEPIRVSIDVRGQSFRLRVEDSRQVYLRGPFVAGRVTVGQPVYLHLRDNTPYGEGLYNSYQSGPSYFDDLEVRRGAGAADEGSRLADMEALGRLLFHDPVLSGGNDRACAGCHRPDLGFADGRTLARALDGSDLYRNTPATVNLGLQKVFFLDGREPALDALAATPITDPEEMNQHVAELVAELTAIPEYRTRFGALWPARPIGLDTVSEALGAYVRTLMELGSRYDLNLYRQGTLNADEDAGLILFEGKARCTTCHTLTPVTRVGEVAYHEPLFKVIGLPADAEATEPDDDPGRAAITLDPADFGAFRVPELRNLTRTAPYMHNGVFRTLGEVVAFYNAGGGAGLGLDIPNLSPEIQQLHLSDAEQAQLVAFLEALSPDRPNYVERPAAVPSGLPVGGS